MNPELEAQRLASYNRMFGRHPEARGPGPREQATRLLIAQGSPFRFLTTMIALDRAEASAP